MKTLHGTTTTEAWLLRLQAGVEAGYYRTEPALGEQERFPWQDKTCSDCPFWKNSVCTVRMAARSASAHTCTYFDMPNRAAAQLIIQRRYDSGPQWDES